MRLRVVKLIFFTVFCCFIGRIIQLSKELRDPLKAFSDSNEVIKIVDKAPDFDRRRDIIDRNDIVLTTDLPIEEVYADPKDILFPKETALGIAKIFPELNAQDLENKFRSNKRFIYIKRKVSPEEKNLLLKLGDPGLSFEARNTRFYPQGKMFASVIGSTDIDNKGATGIEKYFDKTLANSVDRTPFKLTVDTTVNYIIRDYLMKGMEEYQATAAAAILMKVKTGEVISMVSLPDFHPKNASQLMNDPAYNNHATLSVYEMGSVFKVFNTIMALENGIFARNEKYNSSKPFRVGNFIIKDEHGGHGLIGVPEILIYSSNVGSASMALELGREKQEANLRKLHLFEKSPLELPEVGAPMTPNPWNKTAVAALAYGYGMSVSLISVLGAFNAAINDGCYVKPTLLFMKDEQKNQITSNCERVMSEDNSAILRKALRLVVMQGTGKRALSQKVMIGGKTGTSFNSSLGYNAKSVRATFVSAFPIDNPEYSLLVFFDGPKRGYAAAPWCTDASCNAVPTSKQIIESIYEILD